MKVTFGFVKLYMWIHMDERKNILKSSFCFSCQKNSEIMTMMEDTGVEETNRGNLSWIFVGHQPNSRS